MQNAVVRRDDDVGRKAIVDQSTKLGRMNNLDEMASRVGDVKLPWHGVKVVVDGTEVTVVGNYIVEKYAGGEKEAYIELEWEISTENRFCHAMKSQIFGSPYFGHF